jgi:hypothetical protein
VKCRLSKLSFYGGLVDDRPNLPNSLVPKFIEHILGEADLSAVHWKAKKRARRRNVEAGSSSIAHDEDFLNSRSVIRDLCLGT